MTFATVADLDDIGVGTSLAVEVEGVPIAVVRLGAEEVKAVHNICSHQHYELAPEGWIGPNSIECALHGSTFDLDTGRPQCLPALAPIPVFACRIHEGSVQVDVARQLNDAAHPEH